MKKHKILIVLQMLILVGVIVANYSAFTNKVDIKETKQLMVNTQDKLATTFQIMEEVSQKRKEMLKAKLPLAVGESAPFFELEDENNQKISSTDYLGKKTLLVFSQETCPYCEEFLPILNKFQEEEQANVNVVVMQIESFPEENKKYKKNYGIQPTFLAAGYEDMVAYKIQSTPTSVLIDQEGKILGTELVSTLEGLKSFVNNNNSM